MDFKSVPSIPWFSRICLDFQRIRTQDRLPHALLIVARDGLGARELAQWIAELALCGSDVAPCGTCPSCTLFGKGNHPDLHQVELEEDAQVVKVEQIRELIEAMQHTSYRGVWRAGIVFDAHCMNLSAANAFLKTLEEPPPNTLLILVAGPNHRLPATISSRCRRIVIPVPDARTGLAWLTAQGIAMAEARQRLDLAQGAPVTASKFDADTVPRIHREMSEDLASLGASQLDPSLVADRWLKADFPLRLMWLENWITDRVRDLSLSDPARMKSVDAVGLSGALLKAKIRKDFRFLDDVRELKRPAVGINMQLALEGVLMRQFFEGH